MIPRCGAGSSTKNRESSSSRRRLLPVRHPADFSELTHPQKHTESTARREANGAREGTARILDGRAFAERLLRETRREVEESSRVGWMPRLISLKVGAAPDVDLYIRNQRRIAEQVGVIFEEKAYPAEISCKELLATIHCLNIDPRVTGIILQRPVPRALPIKRLQASIHPLKDVEGLNPASIGNIVYNELELGPCTAIAAIELLKSSGVRLSGLEVTVVGHSEIVGKPIAFLLMAEGATVTVCHHLTREVATHSRRSDALLVAVGQPGLISGEMLKAGAVVIDIGINQVEGADGKSQVVGDCDFESCQQRAGWITPVPGGVGPVTVAILMRNTLIALRRQREHYEHQYVNFNRLPS